ncbi:4-(cytidine 5'-diphospho)-2-C-methyl-D-erythritol kinase [Arsenophonus symbiont of Ornithomya chloropus]|uniref:4-(cytidine 5'-diphospho)-2-C-methyl-D-erythritol kinase n=1 Tax=Arsenophonus symbiont of Ornithomya chloropus TaxID=634121 RepID=UPI0032B21CAD
MILNWPSPAKLNLFLHITGLRNDGYHNIQTLFQFLNYGDEIIIKSRRDNQIQLMTPFMNIIEKHNLIIKAARLLQNYCMKMKLLHEYQGADIYIKKKLPIGGGLGGGSSNAATTLIALNFHWKTNINDIMLANLANQLGADIPFFIKGHSAFAEGIGNKLFPINLKEKWYLVAYPGIVISTQKVFSEIGLKRNSTKLSLKKLLKKKYVNDCEAIVRKKFIKVEKLSSWMQKYTSSRLTGTGSCVFGEFKTKSAAYKILNKAPKWVQCFIAKGINRSPLHIFRTSINKY